jgi:isoleucyl-tRNA synthetase
MCLVLDKETDEPHPELANIMEQVADKIEQHGIEIWQSISLDELGIDSSRYYKKFDTLDVWFDSGVVHTASKDSSDEYVADLYLEGSDQYRGWFNSSLLTSVAMYGKAPYKKVLTHGFVVDGKGRKMSKSIGNIIEPEKVIKQMGADVLRLWVAASEYRTELSVSNEILERVKEAYRRIRNTARFLLANISDLDLNRRVKSEELLSIDKWLLYRVNLLQEEIIEHYNNFNFHLIYKTIFNFCSNDLGGFYLDVVKDRQYTGAKNGLARRSAQTAMDHALRALTKWIAPILSFTAEEIWQTMRTKAEDPSIFIGNWYQCPKVEFSDLQFWQHIIGLREKVNKQIEHMRASGDIGSALDVSVKLYLNDDWMALLQPGADELHYIFLTSRVEIEQFQDLGVELLSGVNAEFSKIELKKCSRCWHRCIPTDSSDEICSRCQVNLTEEGEARAYA